MPESLIGLQSPARELESSKTQLPAGRLVLAEVLVDTRSNASTYSRSPPSHVALSWFRGARFGAPTRACSVGARASSPELLVHSPSGVEVSGRAATSCGVQQALSSCILAVVCRNRVHKKPVQQAALGRERRVDMVRQGGVGTHRRSRSRSLDCAAPRPASSSQPLCGTRLNVLVPSSPWRNVYETSKRRSDGCRIIQKKNHGRPAGGRQGS